MPSVTFERSNRLAPHRFKIFWKMNLLRLHTPLCIVFSSKRDFLSSVAQMNSEVFYSIGKLIGMGQISRWITGSLRMSDKTGRRILVSPEIRSHERKKSKA
jgi:hypothetical protein